MKRMQAQLFHAQREHRDDGLLDLSLEPLAVQVKGAALVAHAFAPGILIPDNIRPGTGYCGLDLDTGQTVGQEGQLVQYVLPRPGTIDVNAQMGAAGGESRSAVASFAPNLTTTRRFPPASSCSGRSVFSA